MTDADRLSALVAVWWEAVDSFTHLLEHVGDDQWPTPTDLPGWNVHAVAAHTAHLEALLAGRSHDDIEVGEAYESPAARSRSQRDAAIGSGIRSGSAGARPGRRRRRSPA